MDIYRIIQQPSANVRNKSLIILVNYINIHNIYFFIAVKPDVNLTYTENANFVKIKDGNVFEVQIGREFNVTCFSHGTYRGNVTWSKWNKNTNSM